MKINKKIIQSAKITKFVKFVLTSAPFALLLSIAFFWYEMYENDKENDKMISELKTIEQSLSTRYLGIFPNYLSQINELLKDANPDKPFIIFEDVLYYGVLSTPQEFKKMVYRLLELSEKSEIIIVYYDIEGRVFRRMIQETKIKQEYLGLLERERAELLKKYRSTEKESQRIFAKADSIVSEKYFALSRDAEFEKKVKKYLKPLYDSKADTDSLFFRIDEIKRKALDKPVQSITFRDYLNMYQGMSRELIDVFSKHNIELIGLNEYLVMSCWLNDDKAVLAFPSKYATDEIGFLTQDPVFSKYIFTMLEGVKNRKSE